MGCETEGNLMCYRDGEYPFQTLFSIPSTHLTPEKSDQRETWRRIENEGIFSSTVDDAV
jgi:hypothetical protein